MSEISRTLRNSLVKLDENHIGIFSEKNDFFDHRYATRCNDFLLTHRELEYILIKINKSRLHRYTVQQIEDFIKFVNNFFVEVKFGTYKDSFYFHIIENEYTSNPYYRLFIVGLIRLLYSNMYFATPRSIVLDIIKNNQEGMDPVKNYVFSMLSNEVVLKSKYAGFYNAIGRTDNYYALPYIFSIEELKITMEKATSVNGIFTLDNHRSQKLVNVKREVFSDVFEEIIFKEIMKACQKQDLELLKKLIKFFSECLDREKCRRKHMKSVLFTLYNSDKLTIKRKIHGDPELIIHGHYKKQDVEFPKQELEFIRTKILNET